MTEPTAGPATIDWLTPEIVTAVVSHMNADHGTDALLICRAIGGAPDAVTAQTIDVTYAEMTFTVKTLAGSRRIAVPFSRPLTDRGQIRAEVVAWHRQASEQPSPA